MDQRSAYLIQILEKIGAPLMAAIIHAESQDMPAEEQVSQSAQQMAALLSRTVQTSIDLGKSLDLAGNPEQADALRVALAGLAGPLVADRFKQSGSVPGENDLSQILSSFQAVLTFSDNFTPSPENTERLKNLPATGAPVDEKQSTVQFIQAMTPVVSAIAVFPFGQQENLLVQEVTTKLTHKAAEMRENIFGENLSPDDQKFAELALIKALAELYAECHRQETERLSSSEGLSTSMDPVWKAFDTRAAMLEAISNAMLPSKLSSKLSSTPSSAASAVAPPPASPPEEPKTEQPPASPPPAGDNPMSMFSKPRDDDGAPSPPPETPPEKPPETQPEQPPLPAEEEKKDPPSDEGGANPMSFFKPPPKSDEGEA